jgi:type VI secretion system protein ImpL
MPIFLKHIEGSRAGQLEAFDRDKIRIGRQPDNDLAFDPQKDVSVSGYHAEIYRDGETYFIRDLQSRNGTLVNSQKVDRPTQLADGDILQFSARGPKLVFATRDPSVASEAPAPEAQRAPTEMLSVEGSDEKPQPESSLKTTIVAAGLALGALAAVVAVGFYLALPWWMLLGAAAAVLVLLAAGYVAWRFWRQGRVRRQQAAAARQEKDASLKGGSKDNLDDLKRKWVEVLRSLRQSKLHKAGDDAVDALPWFAVLGEPGSGKSALIKAGAPQTAVAGDGRQGPTRNCDWWLFDGLVALDLSGRYVFQAKQSDATAEWQEILSLLKNHRRREALNGVMVTIAADSLSSVSIEKLKEQAAHLRERLDEASQRLGVRFPVYVTVTKCDLIVGFNDFWSGLADKAVGQAVGEVNADRASHSDAARFFDRAFRRICERLERVRLAQIADEQHETALHRTFLFPAELKSLQVPLKAFVDILFRPSSYRDAPFFRGLFLTSARQAGVPNSRLSRLLGARYDHVETGRANRDYFVRDLYSTILPGDRNLASQTALGRERHGLNWAAGLISIVALTLLLSFLFSWSFYNNKYALANTEANLALCRSATATGSGKVDEKLLTFARCQQLIHKLDRDSFRTRLSFNFGLNHTEKVQNRLKQYFVDHFDSQVLRLVDGQIDQNLRSGTNAPLLAATIFQRMDILSECQQNGCPDPVREKDDWARVDYELMLLAKTPNVRPASTTVNRLQEGYQDFLLWQPDASAYRGMYERYYQQVFAWISMGSRWREEIFNSVNTRFPPIRAADFWRADVPGRIDAVYTSPAWQKGISPLLAGLEKISFQGQDFKNEVKEFEQNYKQQTLQRWGEFLARLPEGEAQSRLNSRELALKALGPNSPYQAAIIDASENLSGIFGDKWQGSDSAPWTKTVKQYAALDKKLPATSSTKESAQDNERQALMYLQVYKESLKQLPGELTTPQESFAAAQSAFREGQSQNKPAQPILQAFWSIRMLKGSGLFQDNDPTFWNLLERPVDLAWKAMLEGAGESLQQQWRQIYYQVAPNQTIDGSIETMSPGMKAAKVLEFVNGPAAGFLRPRGNFGYAANTLEGQSVPFTGSFLGFLSTLGSSSFSTNFNLPRDIVRSR